MSGTWEQIILLDFVDLVWKEWTMARILYIGNDYFNVCNCQRLCKAINSNIGHFEVKPLLKIQFLEADVIEYIVTNILSVNEGEDKITGWTRGSRMLHWERISV